MNTLHAAAHNIGTGLWMLIYVPLVLLVALDEALQDARRERDGE